MIEDPGLQHLLHYFFEWLALGAGVFVYRSERRKHGDATPLTGPGQFPIVAGCLAGAAIGNKLAFLVEYPQPLLAGHISMSTIFGGQSIVGGLLGGWLGVEIGKRWAGVSSRTGDRYVPAILTGIVIGRIGCFLAGLQDSTYGNVTSLPWGVDFGDGLRRHPTQLYESILALFALLTWPRWRVAFADTPGLAFRVLMLGYLLWRLGVDAIKPIPYAYPFGLSGIQLLCLASALLIAMGLMHDRREIRYAHQ